MLLQESQPKLHRLRVPVPDLNQPSHGNPLKVLLALLVHERRLDDRPPLHLARQRHGAERRQAEVVGRAQREVAEELQVARRVRAQLQVARGHAVLGVAAEGLQVEGFEGAGQAGDLCGLGFLGLGWFGAAGVLVLVGGRV